MDTRVICLIVYPKAEVSPPRSEAHQPIRDDAARSMHKHIKSLGNNVNSRSEAWKWQLCLATTYTQPPMQRLIQRTSAAQRQAARRAARQTGKRTNETEYSNRQQHKARNASVGMYIKSERERRRASYETGQLAPRYDVGENAVNYATVDPYVLQGVANTWNKYKNDVCIFAEGDRVVVTQGRDKGRIGRLADVNAKGGFGKVTGLNMV